VWEHAISTGTAWHWILDDNLFGFQRRYRGYRVECPAGVALRVVEDFVDRYENIGLAGLVYDKFIIDWKHIPAFRVNAHIYSCLLIKNDLPIRWRGKYNEDTDLCLQVIALGLCTVQVNAFLIEKRATMTMRGGNMTELYSHQDGRLKMARSLERLWPGIVKTTRRFGRPQHWVCWKKLRGQLILREGVVPASDDPEYGLRLEILNKDILEKDPVLKTVFRDKL
jgi:hypothetical protein